MSNKEMLHRKQYGIAAVVAGLALAVSTTAGGAQKGTEGTESVESKENVEPVGAESVVASVETTENRKTQRNSVEKRWRTDKVLHRRGQANSAGHEMVTSGTDKVPGGEVRCRKDKYRSSRGRRQSEETVAGQPEAIQDQPVEYTDCNRSLCHPDWEYADHSEINTAAGVLYRAPEECGRQSESLSE